MSRFPLRRGIDVIRNKTKMFAQTKVTLPPGRHKVVILDEADRRGGLLLPRGVACHVCVCCYSCSMTKAAQQALRRTMELYSSTTRFVLSCNNSTKIIEPIQVRFF